MSQRAKMIKIAFLSFGITTVSFLLLSGQASAFSNAIPDPADSAGSSIIMMDNGQTRYVRLSNSKLRVWFKNPNGNTITISNGNFCTGSAHDYIEGEDRATPAGIPNARDITSFHVFSNVGGIDSTKTGKKYSMGDANCNNDITFNVGNITGDVDAGTGSVENGYYFVNLDIDYAGPTYAGAYSGIQNYFTIKAGGPDSRIGLSATPVARASGFTITQEQVDTTPANITYSAPFGTDCDNTGPETATINFYDLDNAGGSGAQQGGPITVQLRNRTTGNYEPFTGKSNGTFNGPNTAWTGGGDNSNQSVDFKAQPKEKYVLEIHNVFWNNTIQYSIPYSQIFAEKCVQNARLVPKASVNYSNSGLSDSATNITDIDYGEDIIFKNWVTVSNTKGTLNDKFRMKVSDASGNLPPEANVSFTDKNLDPDRDVPSDSNKYTLVKPAVGTYCRETNILAGNTPDYVKTPQGLDKKICATVVQSRWHIKGTSSVTPDVQNPGKGVQFTHVVKNTGPAQSDTITGSVVWGPGGVIPSAGPTCTPRSNYSQKFAPSPNGFITINCAFTIPNTAQDGQQYCQSITWDHTSDTKPGGGQSAPACVTVARPIGPTNPKVTLQAIVNPVPDAETTTTSQFTGKVNVSGFPDVNSSPADGTWGYSQLATKVAATRTTAAKTIEGLGGTQTETRYSCPSGWTPGSPTGPGTCTGPTVTVYKPCFGNGTLLWGSCIYSTAPDSAGKCPSGWSLMSGQCYWSYSAVVDYTYNPTQPVTQTQYYQYYCNQTRSWTGWTTASESCNDYFVCPINSGSGWAATASGITCLSWQCMYGASPLDATIYPGTQPPNCEYRCSFNGARPYLAPNVQNLTGVGELRCFVAPSFQLTCYWDTGLSTTVTVTGNGDYCQTTTTKPAGLIGSNNVCGLYTPRMPTAWLPTMPQPGMVFSPASGTSQLATWGWTPIAASGCGRAVGMPYVKVYGGDVRVGSGIGAYSRQTCTGNATASINTLNSGASRSYTGSGVQHAAISPGFLDQFVSGQYNQAFATQPRGGNMPTALTFANAAGGSGYGGNFGSTGACADFTQSGSGINTVASGTIAGKSNVTTVIKDHVVGDVFISGDIIYNTNWATTSAIPLYQLVVEGNIYISGTVRQLDGLYAAIPDATGTSGGHIYTCATAIRQPVNTTFSGCENQLVVNGAFAAKQIHFLRDCGSLIRSTTNESSSPFNSGGADPQACSANNHAAEVFNYTPEQWIRGAIDSGSNKYDSVSNMPPVL